MLGPGGCPLSSFETLWNQMVCTESDAKPTPAPSHAAKPATAPAPSAAPKPASKPTTVVIVQPPAVKIEERTLEQRIEEACLSPEDAVLLKKMLQQEKK